MSSIKEFVNRLSAGNKRFTAERGATCAALEKHAGSPDKLYDLYDKDIAAFSALLHEWGLVSIAKTRIRQAFKVRSRLRASKRSRSPAPEEEQRQRPKTVLPQILRYLKSIYPSKASELAEQHSEMFDDHGVYSRADLYEQFEASKGKGFGLRLKEQYGIDDSHFIGQDLREEYMRSLEDRPTKSDDKLGRP